ncbi:MAG: hypothetical protein LBJ63_02820 [Prevotellaceae bacterium]|jgi:hypothetical protein|nr:hypothetical protein [Prevotellaceae bacterium]
MGCGCKGKNKEKNAKKDMVRKLAGEYQKKHGGVIVFYLCSDYDFTELENFINDGKKREIEYIL